MESVFLLWYVPEGSTDDDELLIGVYTTEPEARAAINRVKGKPGFVDYPDRFQIHPYQLNRDGWTEGFARNHSSR
jgi:hypothetical protein